MAMRKFGAPATSHVRLVTAEDIDDTEMLRKASQELSKVTSEKEDDKKKQKGQSDSGAGGR